MSNNVPAKAEKVDGAALAVITATEIDRQVATAKQYPRVKAEALSELRELVTSSSDIAMECFYTLTREETDRETGKKIPKFIYGPSVRFAELLVYCWTNMRVAVRIVEEGAEFLTAQGIAHDLERNNAVSVEVRRRITNKSGHRYGADMIGVTGAAASSIAWRNAVFDLIPPAVWRAIYEAARKAAAGSTATLPERISNAIAFFVKAGAVEAHIYPALGVETRADLTGDHLIILAGLWARVKEKEIDAARIFHPEAAAYRETIGLVAEREPAGSSGDDPRAKAVAGDTDNPKAGNDQGKAEDKAAQKVEDSAAKKDDAKPSKTGGKKGDGPKKEPPPADQVQEDQSSGPPIDAQAEADEAANLAEAVRLDLELVDRVESEVANAARGHKLTPILEARGVLNLIAEHSPSPDAKARALAILDRYELPPEEGK